MFRSLTCAPTSVCSMSSSTSSTILPCPPPSSSFFHSGALSPRLRLLPALQLLVLGSLVSLTGPPNTTYNPRQRISRPRQQPPVAQPITSWLTAFFLRPRHKDPGKHRQPARPKLLLRQPAGTQAPPPPPRHRHSQQRRLKKHATYSRPFGEEAHIVPGPEPSILNLSEEKMNTAFAATILTYSIHGTLLLGSILVATLITRQQHKMSWIASLFKAIMTMATVNISPGLSLPKTLALKAFLALLITVGSLLGSSGLSVAIIRPGQDSAGNINVAYSMKLALTTFSQDDKGYEYPKPGPKVFGVDRSRRSPAYPKIVFKQETSKMAARSPPTKMAAPHVYPKMAAHIADTKMAASKEKVVLDTQASNVNRTKLEDIRPDTSSRSSNNSDKMGHSEDDYYQDNYNRKDNVSAAYDYYEDNYNRTDNVSATYETTGILAWVKSILTSNELENLDQDTEAILSSEASDNMIKLNGTETDILSSDVSINFTDGTSPSWETFDNKIQSDIFTYDVSDNFTEETTPSPETYANNPKPEKKSISTGTILTFISAFGLTCLAVGVFCGLSFACGIMQACKNRARSNSNNTPTQQLELNNI